MFEKCIAKIPNQTTMEAISEDVNNMPVFNTIDELRENLSEESRMNAKSSNLIKELSEREPVDSITDADIINEIKMVRALKGDPQVEVSNEDI
jgi:hypothetical protein